MSSSTVIQNDMKARICWANILVPKSIICVLCSRVSIGLAIRVTEKPTSPVIIVLKAIADVRSLGGTIANSKLVELTALAAPKNRLIKR